MHRLSTLVALAAAAAVAVLGIRYGTYAAGGSDSSCYALMAEAFAAGTLQPTSELVSRAPWPEAAATFAPGGFVPSPTDPAAAAPVCAPGFSLLLAPFVAIGGSDAVFVPTPLSGALLVWLTFLAARRLAGPLAGALAAVLIAASPPMLYQVVQPMNDVTTAALWMATVVALGARHWTLAGICCGLAVLVRPNLLPLAIVAFVFVALDRSVARVGAPIRDHQSRIPRAARFAVGALPFGIVVLLLNNALYGSPFRTGYGQLENLFGLSAVGVNAPRYLSWLIQTHTLFPLLGLTAPFVVPREKRSDVLLASGLIAATCAVYFLYTPFDEWSYLRFLLPAIALMLVLASAVTLSLLQYAPAFARTVIVAVLATAVALFGVRAAGDRHAFNLRFLEQRYRSAGVVIRDQLPAGAVVLSVWDSGAVRFHGGKEALAWAALEPAWLDRGLVWLEENGRPPYILLESWEEPGFRRRFGTHSDVGKLDWPPKYEVDRSVRIYDPRDRLRYDRGERIETEYLWPLRR